MSINAIIFDFFGVICSEVSPFWFQKYFPENEAKNLKDFYAPPADLGKVSEDEFFSNLATLVHKTPKEVIDEFQSFVKLNSGVIELIKKLKPFYKLGLCSNSPSNFIRSILESQKLTDLFDVVIISSECGIIKPDQRIYQLVLDKLAVQAESSIFIDDNPVHVEAAQIVGMKGVIFSDFQELNLVFTKLGIKGAIPAVL